MNITPILFGFLLGAPLGALVTGARGADLRYEASYAFAWFRIVQVWNRTKDTSERRSWSTQLAWSVTRMLRFEWIVLLTILWLIIPVLWILAGWPRLLSIDPDWIGNCFTGSLVGFAAAPWVWLHFSHNFLSEQDRERLDAQQIRVENQDRYRFLTIVSGVLLLGAMFAPLIGDKLQRANKVDFLGISVSIPEHGGDHRSQVVTASALVSGNSAVDELTVNTSSAQEIGNGIPAITVGSDLRNFEGLSTWDRDRAYIAYFIHAANYRNDPSSIKPYETLQNYIAGARYSKEETGMDHDFVNKTATVFACLSEYATKIRDIHLYFLDTNKFLRDLSLLLIRARDQQSAAIADRLKRDAMVKSTNLLLGSVSSPWPKVAGSQTDKAAPLGQLELDAKELIHNIRDLVGQSTVQRDIAGGKTSCSAPVWSEIDPPMQLSFAAPNSTTPYPALLAAYSLAAVDSPETGIAYLSDWVQQAEQRLVSGVPDALASRWYLLRAKIDLAQIATKSLQPLPTLDRLTQFERQLTDDFASLLQVNSPTSWNRLCAEIEQGGQIEEGKRINGSGLHAQIGRWLAFNYAGARNYLFELQTPAVFQSWREARKRDLTRHLQEDLEEATALAASSDCYKGTFNFDRYQGQWLGQFQLNVAQLRIARLPTLPVSEVKAERDQISQLLDAAADRLGPSPPGRSESTADRLLGSDPFDDQRLRVSSLRSRVAQIKPQE